MMPPSVRIPKAETIRSSMEKRIEIKNQTVNITTPQNKVTKFKINLNSKQLKQVEIAHKLQYNIKTPKTPQNNNRRLLQQHQQSPIILPVQQNKHNLNVNKRFFDTINNFSPQHFQPDRKSKLILANTKA